MVANDQSKLFEGHFETPMAEYMRDLIPEESRTAHFQLLVPGKGMESVLSTSPLRPLCIHLAGTGDHVSSDFM